jgi:gliding motility-associated lipoprotein GldH
MTRIILGGLLFLVTLLLNSCNGNIAFQQKIDIADNNWAVNEVPDFSFTISDTAQLYDVFFTFRYSLDYEYYNLYVRHTLTGIEENVISTLLHEVILMDRRTGRPKGTGSGGVFDFKVRAIRNQKFPRVGPYRLTLQQYMRRDPLPGIMAAGISIERVVNP